MPEDGRSGAQRLEGDAPRVSGAESEVDVSRLRVAFRTLGCKVNRVESEDIAADLLGRGVEIAAPEDAALVVVNTCTVTAEADAKARKAVRQVLRLGNSPVVVVTGCLAAVDPAGLEALDDRVVVEADKERVAARVAEIVGVANDVPHAHAIRAGEGFRTRAMLKIEDGCDAFCAYCIVPQARGLPRSVPLAEVVAQAGELVQAGVREIVLTGINIGRYESEGALLPDVVAALAATGIARLRLSSIEPPDLTDRLLEVLAATPAACPHLHVPLQSGSDAVLAAMGRTYSIAEYEARIGAARLALPGLAVTTDIMAGFPTETDAQAAESRAACERIGFAKLHVFRYSRRPGTPAAELPQVPARTIAERAADLRALGQTLRGEFTDARLGTQAEVLVESVEADGTALGTTPDYLHVRLRTEDATPGSLVTARLLRRDGESVLAEV